MDRPLSHTEFSSWLLPLDRSRFHVAYIFLLCLLLYFPFLGARDFWDRENQYAEITRVMLLDADYLVPKLNNEVWTDRPIFFFWLTTFFSWLAGRVNEWTIRLPSALSATVLMQVFYFFVKKRVTPRIAFLATLVLATCLLSVHAERHSPVNMPFFLFISLAMFLIMETLVFDSARSIHVYGAWFFLGLACLTKGPVAILFPGITVLLYLLYSRRWKDVLALRPLTGLLLLFAVTAPWFAYVEWKTSGYWATAFFAHQNVWHYLGHMGHNLKPLSYYGFNFFAGFIPWIFLFIPFAMSLWQDRCKIREKPILFHVLWFVSVLLFAPVSEGQHGHDLYLIYPSVALAFGFYLDRLIYSTPGDAVLAWTRRSTWFACGVLIVSGASAPLVAALFYHWPVVATLRLVPTGLVYVAEAVWILYVMRRRNYPMVIVGFVVVTIVGNILLHVFVFTSLNEGKSRSFAEKMGVIVKPGRQVGIYKSGTFYKFNFYSRIKRLEALNGPEDVVIFLSRPGAKFILVKERRLSEIKGAWKGDINSVLSEPIGSERWVLLYSCTSECEPLS